MSHEGDALPELQSRDGQSEHHTMSNREKLVYMANQIAAFFEAMPEGEAVPGIAKHINDFWEPRMRRAFLEIAEAGGDGLKPSVLEAVPLVRRPAPAGGATAQPEPQRGA